MIYDGLIEKCLQFLVNSKSKYKSPNKFANEQGNKTLKVYEPVDVDINKFDEICPEEWFMSDNYKALDIERSQKNVKQIKKLKE